MATNEFRGNITKDYFQEYFTKGICSIEDYEKYNFKIISCQENKFDCCFKVSAKTGYNVHESMDKLIDIIVKRIDEINLNEIKLNRDTLTIGSEIHSEKDKYSAKQTNCC